MNNKQPKGEKITSKNGKIYYRSLKRAECIDCGNDVTIGSKRCHTCRGLDDKGGEWYTKRGITKKDLGLTKKEKLENVEIDPKWLTR